MAMNTDQKWDWAAFQIAWIDVETDGLATPEELPLLLEVAIVLTTVDLVELGRYSTLIHHSHDVLDALTPCSLVVEMHTKNGLWKDLRAGGGVSIAEAQRGLLQVLDENRTSPHVAWGGCSPGVLDRPMLASLMPDYYKRIDHRSVDVSSLKLAMKNWAGIEAPEDDDAAHRALADTLSSIAMAKHYRGFLNTLAEAQAA